MSFLNSEVSGENGRFKTTVYRKPTFISVSTHFDSFLATTYEYSMIYTLAYRCFKFSLAGHFDNELH